MEHHLSDLFLKLYFTRRWICPRYMYGSICTKLMRPWAWTLAHTDLFKFSHPLAWFREVPAHVLSSKIQKFSSLPTACVRDCLDNRERELKLKNVLRFAGWFLPHLMYWRKYRPGKFPWIYKLKTTSQNLQQSLSWWSVWVNWFNLIFHLTGSTSKFSENFTATENTGSILTVLLHILLLWGAYMFLIPNTCIKHFQTHAQYLCLA